ncbi:MAG: putative helicase [Chthoniobacteraceae bacterium]|nr:putative helicase [Chthoniobacteraceae bacterium]
MEKQPDDQTHHAIAFHRYPESFAAARKRNRQLLFIAGPTNSGKTYAAFRELMGATHGIYLAPLRLMAAEFWDRLKSEGISCSLVTGEERIIDPQARYTSSTIEMLAPEADYDVAVIDEVQMIADKDRGWAWTQAIVGVNARRVILVGSADSEPVVRALAERLGEPLEIVRTERLTPLEVASHPYHPKQRLEAGTAVISFSRRDVLYWKQTLGGADCAAIYGALSPEVRRNESRRFASGEAPAVSATDAIGMGLNLPVKTIVFTTLEKWDGTEEITLSDSAIRQIAGRAGRYGMHESGIVTAMNWDDLKKIRHALHMPPRPLPVVAPIAPHLAMLRVLSAQSGRRDLVSLLEEFAALPEEDGLFRKADVSAMRELASMIAEIRLPLESQFTLCACPIDIKEKRHVRQWLHWVDSVAERIPSPLPHCRYYSPEGATSSSEKLYYAEAQVRLLAAYRWMHHRLASLFPDADEAAAVSHETNAFISNSLRLRVGKNCGTCGKSLRSNSRLGQCGRCYRLQFAEEEDE